MKSLGPIISEALRLSATDIHLEENTSVFVRDSEGLHPIEFICTPHVIADVKLACSIQDNQWWSIDTSFTYNQCRVRAHIYRSNQRICGTLRLIYQNSISIETDRHKELLKTICTYTDGLVLVTGPTGSAKSYTLACCIEYINNHMKKHIVTLEDPIEYIFQTKQSLIHQKQLAVDIETMSLGIRDSLREDPDIIMVGELRDRATMEAALRAAETGHLVLATMHTQRSIMAVHRIISMFPGEEQDEVRHQISQVLRVVLCQRLLRWDDEFVVVRDILLNTSGVSNLIRNKKESQIVSLQETQRPMQTLEMDINILKGIYGSKEEFNTVI